MARPHTLRKSAATLPQAAAEELATLDQFTSLPPISQPKPWSDEIERSAVFHCLKSAPPLMALCAAGVPHATAGVWLSDDPPEAYKSACVALSGRLKEAEQACAAQLFGCINRAAQDPRYWTAAAWTLERKHGYVAQQQALNGPSIVVNIGQVNVAQASKAAIPIQDADIVDALPVVVASSTELQAK